MTQQENQEVREDREELLSITDFAVTLFRRKWTFIAVFALVMIATLAYLILAKRSYRLSGTIDVGRFQRLLLVEGEFVAHQLEDYSFITRALEGANLDLDIPISRLQRKIDADVINEVKKISDVGLVSLTVEYHDAQLTHDIFKALTDQLIREHGELLVKSVQVFRDMENAFFEKKAEVEASMEDEEAFVFRKIESQTPRDTVPANLLAHHMISEKNAFLKEIIKDIYYIRLEADTATRSYNTRLAAEPEVPDEHFKPRKALTLVMGGVIGLVLATCAALALDLYMERIRPRLK